ncbi:hypothetical protein [[Phormidium ambiguum] IAM M-71]|uniref:hypothetical protein n=1 Tax=[Phormidium ambiguum] IAM M-71 TaxID=454136 RepID=UPI0011611312|nr:hypothetical protein [Phormidium ambiguum]
MTIPIAVSRLMPAIGVQRSRSRTSDRTKKSRSPPCDRPEPKAFSQPNIDCLPRLRRGCLRGGGVRGVR